MKKWEYDTEWVHVTQRDEVLTMRGSLGWELCVIQQCSLSGEEERLYFKREIEKNSVKPAEAGGD